ncbi:hypothetical protein OJ998_11540 [Solirubrobacter taibaiensis]|nr:hypothetical protein [Solirubrobacter taibaiensis]
MTDFLDRYGLQLREARLRRRRRAVRVSLLAVASPAVAAIAVVMTTSSPDIERPATPTATATAPPPVGTWTPKVGRPDKGMPMSIDRTPVSPTATKVLAVLRRPQTDRDRRLAGPRLRYVGPPGEGVQVDGVRALNARYALVPVKRLGTLPGPGLCILGSGGGGCAPVSTVSRKGVSSLSAGAKGTHYFGVVPDGVARVRFRPQVGQPVETVVRENFYELRFPATGPGLMPAQGKLEWIDGNGNLMPRGRP